MKINPFVCRVGFLSPSGDGSVQQQNQNPARHLEGMKGKGMKYEYTVDEKWELDAISNDDSPPAQSPFAAIRQINGALLKCSPRIIKNDEGGNFVLAWKELHPEMTRAREYFGAEPHMELTKTQIEEWNELEAALPTKTYEVELSRKEAFAILCFYCLPDEFSDESKALI